MRFRIMILFLIFQCFMGAYAQENSLERRTPMQKNEVQIESPLDYSLGVLREDPIRGEIKYDPKPEVITIDKKSGKLWFRWVGMDGKTKQILFQRADAINVVVLAKAQKSGNSEYVFSYVVENLNTSGQELSGFLIQCLCNSVQPKEITNFHTGFMGNTLPDFSEGKWIRFAVLDSSKTSIGPGQNVNFIINSTSPPGLVRTRVHGGNLRLMGIGEEMPTELADLLPGYKDWPYGYTIGPVDELAAMSLTDHLAYLKSRVSKFQELGWISSEVAPWYQENLEPNSLILVFQRLQSDLKSEKITTEVYALIDALRSK